MEVEEKEVKEVMEEDFQGMKTLERNLIDCLRSENKLWSSKDHEFDMRCTRDICHQVWIKFASVHQKSPSHKNNNVQKNCSSSNHTKRITKESKRLETNTSITHPPQHNESHCDNSLKYKNTFLHVAHSALSFLILCLKCSFQSTFISILLYCMVVLHKPTQVVISRNTQDLIYPFMRNLRILALPLVERFPVITSMIFKYKY